MEIWVAKSCAGKPILYPDQTALSRISATIVLGGSGGALIG